MTTRQVSQEPAGSAAGFDFHPAVERWFRRRFPEGPTPPQARSWPAIARGRHTLIAAPTGSGKTLAAFLVCIDRYYRMTAEERAAATTSVVYVSPLKALAVDIHHNLQQPLQEIAEGARELGLDAPDLRVAVRTGDTTSKARAAMLRNPPHFLVTTPESLYLLLTAERTRAELGNVQTVIVDEIHTMARDKRGAHLALTLERLSHVCRSRPARIGLSATQRPIETIARLLTGGGDPAGECEIVDEGHARELELAIELPHGELEAVASTEQMGEILDRIAEHVRRERTTLVFVNTRRLAERVAHQLGERLGEGRVAAHHGSLAKERRLTVETALRNGQLGALVATASLELGIDIGPISLVCQIGSPRSIATFLQRIGRSGHNRFAIPKGRVYPTSRDELVECAALLAAVRGGRLDALCPPEAPLDILAQQIIAECASCEWDEQELFALVKRAAPFAELTRQDFETVLDLVCNGVTTGRGTRGAYVQRDRLNGALRARRGARLAALTSGGAIPDVADYRVVADPDETFVGTVNEDWAIESMAGDVFLLGSTSWRIRRVESGVVRVVSAEGAPPSVPFWLGEAPARTEVLSREVSELRREVGNHLDRRDRPGAEAWLEQQAQLTPAVARSVVEYLSACHTALGLLPTDSDLVFERFFDDSGGMQLVIHAPFGGRVNRALGLSLRKRFCKSFDFELQAAANDDAIVLSLGPQHSFPLEDVPRFLSSRTVAEVLAQAALDTPMFAARWRWNLNRALLVLRMRGGRKNPPQLQRMQADDFMAAIFPALAACQENATGPRVIPDHPIVRQTMHDCLTEAMDVRGLESLLSQIERGEVRLHFRDTTEASPLSHEILNARPYTFLDDAPLEERRTRAVRLRRGLQVSGRDLSELDPEALERVVAEAEPEPRTAHELHDVLLSLVLCRPRPEWSALFAELRDAGRATTLLSPSGGLWCALEMRPSLERLLPGSGFEPDLAVPPVLYEAASSVEESTLAAVRGHLEISGPTTASSLAAATALPRDSVEVALAQLEHEGSALRGTFTLAPESESTAARETEFCARRLVARIHHYTIERLRREIEPVSAQDYMRFLLEWQHAVPRTRSSGRAGLASVVGQLQGFELAAGAWEQFVLPLRIEGYTPDLLDLACLSGEVCWGRLSVRDSPLEPRTEAGAHSAPELVSRATPVTLSLRADLHWLMQGVRGERAPRQPTSPISLAVLEALASRGALFHGELSRLTGLSARDTSEGLWDLVARGLVSADGFQPLRALLGGTRPARPTTQRFGLRRAGNSSPAGDGRWSLLTGAESHEALDALAEAFAEQLLARWGVVFYDLCVRETSSVPWREIVWALRRLEARGTVRGGRFVTGFVGEQFALPDAVSLLRDVRKRPRTGEVIRLSAADPLNLTGVVVPGPRVPALRANNVYYRDGLPIAEAEALGSTSPSSGDALSGAAAG